MGKAVRVINVPKGTHKLFRRALALAGAGSQSRWLLTQIRRFIREQENKFGEDLFNVLTDEEKDILSIIESGAAELQHIAEESLLPEKQVAKIITDLIDRGFVEERVKGGKTDQARGAKIKLYFVVGK
jgi:hypothetical protein